MPPPKALRAACLAKTLGSKPLDCGPGGGGGVDLDGGERSGAEFGRGGAEGGGGGGALVKGALEGGRGGAPVGDAGGSGAEEGGGTGGAAVEGFRIAIGGAGGFEPGKGGGTLGGPASTADFEGMGNGRGAGFARGLIPSASLFGRGGVGRRVAAPVGGFGGAPKGSFGAVGFEASKSKMSFESVSAPVLTPPLLFFNFGIPPANSPPSCGASVLATAAAPLSLLDLFAADKGAAVAPGAFNVPGTAGALGANPPVSLGLSNMGADLSFVTAFLSPVPF